MSLYQVVIVTSAREETPGVRTFILTYEDGSPIPYTAGQFITLVFTHHGREERRSFSISSSPALDEPLSFTVKRIENGAYSRFLIEKIKPGDKLRTTGTAGLFTLPQNMNDSDQVFFLAAGIGITPVISLVKTLLHTRPDKNAVLIYSNRSKEEVTFYNTIRELAEQYSNRFKAELLYSSAFNLSRARLNKELLPLLLKEYGVVPKEKMLFYICGPFEYMRMAILSLEEQGIRGDQVKKENFNTNDRKVAKAEPPDTSPHMVTLRFQGKEYHITAAYPDTILQAAKKNGLSLPYSCEVGRCGSCAALCTSGQVWLSYNEVLMDSDLKKGMILTCVAHPVHGNVEIEI
jgi:ferredoxin-NADP reductase